MPAIEKLPLRKTVSHSLRPIEVNESTTAGNLSILENIFQRQYRLERSSDTRGRNIRLLYGDQKTWARLWSIKNAAAEYTTPGYGQMRWMLPIPALFHLKMNHLKIIHATHYDANATPPVKGSKATAVDEARNEAQNEAGDEVGDEAEDDMDNDELSDHSIHEAIPPRSRNRKEKAGRSKPRYSSNPSFLMHARDYWNRKIVGQT